MTSLFHASAVIDGGASIGEGTRIWHFAHVMSGATIGKGCTLGQNVFVGGRAKIGDFVKIQNNVSVYDGVELDDYVFCGPSCVFTNMPNPRSEISRRESYVATKIRRGATIGANATIICGGTIGRYAFIAAGAVVTTKGQSIPDYALMLGVPARRVGWMSRHGHRLIIAEPDARDASQETIMRCPESGFRYREVEGALRCLDHDEEKPL